MFKRFYPSLYLNSTYEINFEALYSKGYRGLIFDIDNTLVRHGFPANEQAIALFDRLKSIGFSCCLLSNNKEPRVKLFNEKIGVNYLFKADKPKVTGYEKAMSLMGTTRKNTVFIGDQLFTDIFGANRTGLYSILVKPIHPKEEIQIVLKRKLEKIVLYAYKRHRLKNK
jgi:HAD superfamily phosphatase (TIGR01668 family)